MLTIPQIESIVKTMGDVKRTGLYTRLDLESIEELIPNSIESDMVSLKEIPATTPSNMHKDYIDNRFSDIQHVISDALLGHYSSNINEANRLVNRLLYIRELLCRVSMMEVDPIDGADNIFVDNTSLGLTKVTDNNGLDLSLGFFFNPYGIMVRESINPSLNESILKLQYRLVPPIETDTDKESSEWNGYIIKKILDLKTIEAKDLINILNNPKKLIDGIDAIITKILTSASIVRARLNRDSDWSIADLTKSSVEFNIMINMDPEINGFMKDNGSRSLIELFSKIRYKTL